MLRPLIGYVRGAGLDARWVVIPGDDRVGADDVVLRHDPQTAGMITRLRETGASVIWRAHVGLGRAARRLGQYVDVLEP
jgi:hypothetical protein